MMKNILPLFFIICTQGGFSQTRFTKFVENKKVPHAVVSSDTFHFSNPNLSLLLRDAFTKGKIKVSVINEDKNTDRLSYANHDAIVNRVAPNRESKVMDADGNVTATVAESEDALSSSRYFDEQTRDLVEVQQILYIESGMLRSYIPFVSPKYAVFTSWGQKLGISNVFSTAFNKSRRISRSTKRKAMTLGSTTTSIRLDTFLQPNMLKQLYGQNLLQALWPQLHKKHYEIYRMDTLSKISFEKINMSLLSNPTIPIYDEEGKITGTRVLPMEDQPLNLSLINRLELSQNFYYHSGKNIVFSTIGEIILYARKTDHSTNSEVHAPVLKIILK